MKTTFVFPFPLLPCPGALSQIGEDLGQFVDDNVIGGKGSGLLGRAVCSAPHQSGRDVSLCILILQVIHICLHGVNTHKCNRAAISGGGGGGVKAWLPNFFFFYKVQTTICG